MKKHFILALLLLPLSVSAQDTVGDGNPWYMFWPHGDVVSLANLNNPQAIPIGNSMIQYYGKDSGDIVVYGVAWTMVYLPIEEERENEIIDMTPTVMLFNHVAHGNPPTVSFIDSTNVFGMMKQCKFEYRTIDGDEYFSPSYEFYFNMPHHFTIPTDTFYISYYFPQYRGSNYSNWYQDNWYYHEFTDEGHPEHYMFYNYGICELTNYPPQEGWFAPSEDGMFGFRPNNIQYTPRTTNLGPIYPIIGLRCMPPTQIRFTGREGNAAILSWWQAEAGESYQLSVGASGSNPYSGTRVSTTDTFYTFTGLEPDVIYQAWVRKACRYTTAGYDTVVWSDWSNPTTFRTAVGISAVEGDAAFSLTPNPAHGSVQLTLEQAAEGAELTLCDLGGRELRRERVSGTSHTLDIATLPAGVYFLKLTTPQGVATRRLVIAR